MQRPFSRISYRLTQIEETADTPEEERAFRILQRIIPDLVINGRSLCGEGPLAGTKTIVDVKKLSPCSSYPDERTSNPSAVVNTRQKKVNTDYDAKAKSLDARVGYMRGGFDAELNSSIPTARPEGSSGRSWDSSQKCPVTST